MDGGRVGHWLRLEYLLVAVGAAWLVLVAVRVAIACCS